MTRPQREAMTLAISAHAAAVAWQAVANIVPPFQLCGPIGQLEPGIMARFTELEASRYWLKLRAELMRRK